MLNIWQRPDTPRGQGLLEVIIAFAVVGVGLGASLTLLLTGGVENRRAELRSVAANLGREAIEVVRAQRDSNWLAGNPFDNGLYGTTAGTTTWDGIVAFDPANGGWTLDFDADPPSDFSGDGIVYSLAGTFRQLQGGVPGGTATQFRRIIQVRAICADPAGAERSILDASTCAGGDTKIGVAGTARIRWDDRGKTFNSVLEERLYDWQI